MKQLRGRVDTERVMEFLYNFSFICSVYTPAWRLTNVEGVLVLIYSLVNTQRYEHRISSLYSSKYSIGLKCFKRS